MWCVFLVQKSQLEATARRMAGEERKARCLLCQQLVPYALQDTTPLLRHLVDQHPDLSVAPFESRCQVDSGTWQAAKSTILLGSADEQMQQRQKRYRTTRAVLCSRMVGGMQVVDGGVVSVEMWRPGKAAVACPACGMEAPPVIRRARTDRSRTPLGALCAVGCWPFCLLPLLMLCAEEAQLFCAHCSRYLGSYDPRTGEPKPLRTTAFPRSTAPSAAPAKPAADGGHRATADQRAKSTSAPSVPTPPED
ncbi:uncharacterized protein LOC126430024 [Schistocerca serialis cubense]|uniref:uncharacterized protein LOC126430024 n=1 Tax=Schistocerca serialis cubense TaxID=2023355 RepID=UPI00214EC658|nr:uncharacterized protein LOC126430024 [Schistocerca serialis cubense]